MTEPGARPGRAGLWRRVARRLAPYVEMKFPEVVFVYRHDLSEILAPVCAPGCTIEVLEEARLSLLSQVWRTDTRVVMERMARGDRCYGGFVDGRIAHYSWVQTAGRHELADAGRRLAVRPGDSWVYHCRTAEWARGRGLYTAALRTILGARQRQTDSHCWIYTTADNVASQRGILRAGFALDRSLRSLRLGLLYVPLP